MAAASAIGSAISSGGRFSAAELVRRSAMLDVEARKADTFGSGRFGDPSVCTAGREVVELVASERRALAPALSAAPAAAVSSFVVV